MDKEEALEIISMIADGIDPFGEKDPLTNIPENNPVTIRALCIAITSLLSENDRMQLRSKYRTKKLAELSDSVCGPLEEYLNEKIKEKIFEAFHDLDTGLGETAETLGLNYERLTQKICELNTDIHLKNIFSNIETDYAEIFIIKYGTIGITLNDYIGIIEKNAVKEALLKTKFNKTLAAKELGVSMQSFKPILYEINFQKNVNCKLDDRVQTSYFKYSGKKSLDEFLREVERRMIELALNDTGYNLNCAAEKLGLSIETLGDKLEQHGIKTG